MPAGSNSRNCRSTMRRYSPELVYVDGWVGRPGCIRSDIPLTLAGALARAGGVKTGAKTGDILIMRHDANGGVQTYSAAAPVGGLWRAAGPDDPLLKSFDVVYVPRGRSPRSASSSSSYSRRCRSR